MDMETAPPPAAGHAAVALSILGGGDRRNYG
jgi:hypothetical protein